MATNIMKLVDDEVFRARGLFPGNKMLLHALEEECGEVTKAMLNQYHVYRQDSDRSIVIEGGIKDTMDLDVQTELIQTIAMCVRLLTEGDADLPYNPAGGMNFKAKV